MTLLLGLTGCAATLDLDPPGDAGPDDGTNADAAAEAPDAGPPDASPQPDVGPSTDCVDLDRDGYGEGCAAGADCDEGDPARHAGAIERCDGRDTDCDGRADEGFAGLGAACTVGEGACRATGRQVCAEDGAGVICDAEPGAPTDETCNATDDDCDGQVDEQVVACCQPGTARPCGESRGECTEGQQICDADRVWQACSGQGPQAETCNMLDDDCDGLTDEGLRNACNACGPVPDEVCNGQDDDCDGRADEGVTNRCGACGPEPREVCNGRDDDCDGRTDERVTNACGGCGAVPAEVCNGQDDDCDGRTDERVANACGACGPAPDEVCNGQDDDCDGRTDEAVRNACGGCGPVPAETCNGADDDCDGVVDNGVCAPARNACINPPVITLGEVRTGPIGDALANHVGCVDDNEDVGEGPEVALRFSTPFDGIYCVDLSGSDFDTVLYVREDRCLAGRRLVCDDDGGMGNTSRGQFVARALTDYFVFIDSFNAAQPRGTWRIRITRGPC